MDKGAWWATVRGAAELDMTEPVHNHIHVRKKHTQKCTRNSNPKKKVYRLKTMAPNKHLRAVLTDACLGPWF